MTRACDHAETAVDLAHRDSGSLEQELHALLALADCDLAIGATQTAIRLSLPEHLGGEVLAQPVGAQRVERERDSKNNSNQECPATQRGHPDSLNEVAAGTTQPSHF